MGFENKPLKMNRAAKMYHFISIIEIILGCFVLFRVTLR
jgi:hypothetical protein